MRHLPGNRDVVGGQYLTFVSPKKKKKKVVGQYYNNYSYIYIYIYIYIRAQSHELPIYL